VIAWLAPAAIAALALLAGPVVVHLLARRHARRVVFPASHFVRPAHAAAVRLRRPSDIGLLLLRLAIVGVAIAAAARPVPLTSARLSQWDARTSRAVIVDTSPSMPAPDAASALAAREEAGVFRARRIDTADLTAGLQRAVQWLATVPPSRHEIAVVSDFQRGSIDRGAVSALPPEIGLRFVRAGALPAERRATLRPVDGWRGARWQASVVVDPRGTAATWTQQPGAGPASGALPGWLTVAAPASDAAAADRALRAAASFGVPAGDEGRRAIVIFAGGSADGTAQPVRADWMVDAALALRTSDLLRETGVDVSIEERRGSLAVHAAVAATSPAAPAVVRAVILAVRPDAIADPELETEAIRESDLLAWRRDASPVGPPAAIARTLRDTADGEGQGRWLWLLALVLLGVETWVRRTRPLTVAKEAQADAA
jgi:hypothetical protein